MSVKYFALIWEDFSEPWRYYCCDSENLEELKKELSEARKQGDMHPNSKIELYKGEHLEQEKID